jgi:hypothetical protein
MRTRLASNAEDTQNLGVGARHEFRRHRGSSSGAQVGRVVCGQASFRGAAFWIQQSIRGMNLLLGVSWCDHNQLHSQRRALAVIAGHEEKPAIGYSHLCTQRHHHAGVAVLECIFDCSDEFGGIEAMPNIVFAENAQAQQESN